MASFPRTRDEKKKFVELWHNRLTMGYRARLPHKRRWKELQELYKGNYWTERSLNDRVASMIHFATERQMAANLYFQSPSFNFNGYTINGMHQARIAQKIYMMERKVMKAEEAERQMIDFALKYGVGILKHGWNAQYGTEPAWADKKRRSTQSNGSIPGTAKSDDLKLPMGQMTEHDSSVRFGHPNVKAIAPWNFLVDPDALTYEEARWVAHIFHRPWVDAIRDTRWNEDARKQLEEAGPDGVSNFFGDEYNMNDFREREDVRDSSLSTFIEVYDKTTQTIVVISGSVDLPFRIVPYPFLGKDGPYTILSFFPNDDTFWPIPYMDTFTSEALAINKAQTAAFDHYQKWGKTRGAYDENRLDGDKLNQMARSEDGEFVPVRSLRPGEKIHDVLHVLPEIPINADTFRIMDIFKGFLQEISGITENDLGSGRGVQTATEASIIQQQTGLRKGDMRFRVDAALEDSARKTMTLLRQFYDADDVIPVVGPQGQQFNMRVTREILNGEFDLEIEPGSTERVDRQARFKQLVELWRETVQAAPILAQQGAGVNLIELYKMVLKEADVIKNPDRIVFKMPPQAPPQQGQANQPGQRGGASPAALGTVNNAGRMPEATDAFQNGRRLSETQTAGSAN